MTKEKSDRDMRLNKIYRPEKFKDVVGQKIPVNVLRGSIATNSVQNAYLLDGESGSGKTTLARIFANALICRNRDENQEPCGECEACVKYKINPALVDIIEIDAGENGGVNKIRELKEAIKYAPKEAYKIIIIDEAHMLTKEGATALLKTIEEPPERTIFLIATNEVEKIMKTIKNRCIKLKFKKINPILIEGRLRMIAEENNIQYEDGVLLSIAVASDGMLREALSIFQQVLITTNGRKIKKEDLDCLLNTEKEYIKKILYLILKKDIIGITNLIESEEESFSENDFDCLISRMRRYLCQKDINVEASKVISSIINIFIEYKNKITYNMALKTLIELSAIDSISIVDENEECIKWFLKRFDIQDKDDMQIALEKSILNEKNKEENNNDKSTKLDSKEVNERTEIVRNKAELFMSLMNIKFRDFEYKFNTCELEIDEDKILNFTVESREKKIEITGFLKREYAQSLKPICDIEGFIVKVR